MFLVALDKLLALLCWYFLLLPLQFVQGLECLQDSFPQWQISAHAIDFRSDWDQDLAGRFTTVHFFPFSTISACFWMCALGRYLAGEPMIFESNRVFLHWVSHFVVQSLGNPLISWFLWSSTRYSKAAPRHYGSSTMLNCWEGVIFPISFILPSVNKLVCITKKF